VPLQVEGQQRAQFLIVLNDQDERLLRSVVALRHARDVLLCLFSPIDSRLAKARTILVPAADKSAAAVRG
jgi:hypothetical protein